MVSNSKGQSKYSDRSERFKKIFKALKNSEANLIFIGQEDCNMASYTDSVPNKSIILVNSIVNEIYYCVKDGENFVQSIDKFRKELEDNNKSKKQKSSKTNEQKTEDKKEKTTIEKAIEDKEKRDNEKSESFKTADKVESPPEDAEVLSHIKAIVISLREDEKEINETNIKIHLAERKKAKAITEEQCNNVLDKFAKMSIEELNNL